MNNLDYLIIYNSEYNKIRIGSLNDGGYVIADGLEYDLLLSCGISDDITFEDYFTNKYNVNCYAYDGTINNLPHYNNNKINFIKKNISKIESDITTNLLDIINLNNNIFLKMDIETNEFQWLELLKNEHLNKFKQIVIEFHFPFTYEEELFKKLSYPMDINNKINCLDKLSKTHYLIHLHPNNCCGTTIYNNITVPNVFECTYIRKDLCNNIKKNIIKIPDILLDSKNVNYNGDIFLEGYPFTE